MKSKVITHLNPRFEPVAVIWSDTIPDGALQFKAGKFGCMLHLFAEASRRGRITGGDRDTITCPGARTALGLGIDIANSEAQVEHYAAAFSKGLASTPNKERYLEQMKATRAQWRPLLEFGERRHCSFDKAKNWLLQEMPRYDIPQRYVLFKPLGKTESTENIRAVVFLVNPDELSGLVTLLASVVDGVDPLQCPPGPDCFRIAGYAYVQHDARHPRGVLGFLDVDGRAIMRRRFTSDTLTITLPFSLFKRLDQEAEHSILQTPGWLKHARKEPIGTKEIK